MSFERAAGLLLHPTSLPGPYGIGDLGPTAFEFVDWLHSAGLRLWQVLPLGQTGYGDSPYACHSAFAGNPLLISPELMAEAGLLTEDDLADVPLFPTGKVDYGWVIWWKQNLLRTAFAHLKAGHAPDVAAELGRFVHEPRVQVWAIDFALFMALKEANGGQVWNTWEHGIATRDPAAMAAAVADVGEQVEYHLFCQYLFREQWSSLRAYANELDIKIVGDIPIFVAYDSADVWCNPHLFELGHDGTPKAVAGVPPDYFSATGQLWGNPLYDWKAAQAEDFAWWVQRFRGAFELVDAVRLDHFRGFESFWRVPYGDETAINGEWIPAPGDALFARLQREFGDLAIIAEDLGVITDDVKALRDRWGFPGMRILQFAFHQGANFYLPHLYPTNTAVYTGTHDNDTTNGWWAEATAKEQVKCRAYLGGEPDDMAAAMIRLALGSVADIAIFPMQDALSLGSEGRMNTPGVATANWSWRLAELPEAALAERIREMVEAFDRVEPEESGAEAADVSDEIGQVG